MATYDQHMREAWVWMFDRFVPYPLQNNIHRLPDDVFVESYMGIIEAQQSEPDRENFAKWIQSVFGAGIAKYFMLPYNFKVWAHPIEMMSSSWQGDRVPEVNLERILRNQVADRDDVSWGPNNKFKFPLLGTGMLYERIAEALPQPVRFHRSAEAIDLEARRVTYADGTTEDYDQLISTMPLKELVKVIVDCPAEIVEAANSLHHTEGYFIGIGVAEECPSSKCWMYFPEDDSPFYRVTYLSNYSPKMTPGPGHFSLLAEVSKSAYKPENSDDIIERTIEGLVSSKLLTREQADTKIVSRELMHVPYSYPVPTLGRDEALEIIQPWLMEREVYSRGRFGAWRYEIGNTDHSVMMGVELADRLVQGKPETTWALLPGQEAKTRLG